MKSYIVSSLSALALVSAQSATLQPIPSPNKLPASSIDSPSQKQIADFEKELEAMKMPKPITVILHQNNDGAKITVPKDTLVKVILETQVASTGFDWMSTCSLPDVLELQNKRLKDPDSFIAGAPVKEYWKFKAVAVGQTTLTFSLARPWEKGAYPAKIIRFDISVE